MNTTKKNQLLDATSAVLFLIAAGIFLFKGYMGLAGLNLALSALMYHRTTKC